LTGNAPKLEVTVVAAKTLRTAGFAEYLVRAVVNTLPTQATTEVVELLVRCLPIWRERVRAKPQDWRGWPMDAAEPEAELLAAWQAAGGHAAELDKIREMFAYRQVRHDQVPSFGPTVASRRAAEQIRSFWVTSGHDLAALDSFFTDVDAEFPDVLPG
jgi:hypothetical protein